MKIAISTAGKTLESEVELRFGRASSFLIYDTDTKRYNSIDNKQQLNAAQGAGIQTAGTVINSGASAVISGHCGPKAMKVLKSSGVKVYVTESATIHTVLERFEKNKLTEIVEADVEEHWV